MAIGLTLLKVGAGHLRCHERTKADGQPIFGPARAERQAVAPGCALNVGARAPIRMLFAVLADMTLRGMTAFLPPVTGAVARPKLLGKLSFP